MSNKDRYANVDWNKTNLEIANDVGVTPQRICQVRKDRGIPKVKKKTQADKVLEIYEPGMTYRELGEKSGLTQEQAKHALYQANKKYDFEPEIRLRHEDCGSPPEYDWDSVDWENEKNVEIAERLGCHPTTVSKARKGKVKSPHFRFVNRDNRE